MKYDSKIYSIILFSFFIFSFSSKAFFRSTLCEEGCKRWTVTYMRSVMRPVPFSLSGSYSVRRFASESFSHEGPSIFERRRSLLTAGMAFSSIGGAVAYSSYYSQQHHKDGNTSLEAKESSIKPVPEDLPENKISQISPEVEALIKEAKKGNASVQYNLSVMYRAGSNGCEQDYKKAVELLEEAVAQGYASAQCDLGYLYIIGKGVEKDEKKGLDLLKKSAFQENIKAQYLLDQQKRQHPESCKTEGNESS